MKLHERCESIIREWPQWSRVERSRMDQLVEEIMRHVIDGTGNHFVASWCERVLTPALNANR